MQKQPRSSADIYQYNFDPNSDSAGANVLRFVGHNKSVLELGAGPGSIARPLVEINKCSVSAVELDCASAELLNDFCDEVHRLDLNDPDWPAILEGRQFDNIVIADVLEHLYDPWATLERALPLLRDDGSIVISLPHVGHASVMACLLDSDFEYRECGLLDRTHIRFFGMKNIQSLVEEAGLRIADFALFCESQSKPSSGNGGRSFRRTKRRCLRALILQMSFRLYCGQSVGKQIPPRRAKSC